MDYLIKKNGIEPKFDRLITWSRIIRLAFNVTNNIGISIAFWSSAFYLIHFDCQSARIALTNIGNLWWKTELIHFCCKCSPFGPILICVSHFCNCATISKLWIFKNCIFVCMNDKTHSFYFQSIFLHQQNIDKTLT